MYIFTCLRSIICAYFVNKHLPSVEFKDSYLSSECCLQCWVNRWWRELISTLLLKISFLFDPVTQICLLEPLFSWTEAQMGSFRRLAKWPSASSEAQRCFTRPSWTALRSSRDSAAPSLPWGTWTRMASMVGCGSLLRISWLWREAASTEDVHAAHKPSVL